MNDIFEDMFDKADALKNVSVEGMKSLSQLAVRVDQINDDIAKLESELSEKKKEKHQLEMETIPNLMDEMGETEGIKLKGLSVGRRTVVSASIPSLNDKMTEGERRECVAKREQCFSWLRENGYGDKIKNDVIVTFGMGEDNLAGDVVGILEEKGFYPKRKVHVPPPSLKSVIKRHVEDGKPIDLDLFSGFLANAATIKRTVT
tara:strand:- start:187 stop:795 length:609 start_codon:yes stop_codon:yes gene_type:complete